jgi:hypothetical protein
MQPKDVPCHIRIKVEPTQKQKGRACRLHGKDFKSIADAARHFNVNYSTSLRSIGGTMAEHYCTTKGLGWAFLTCVFFILGVPVLMWLALEGSSWYERFDLMNPMF